MAKPKSLETSKNAPRRTSLLFPQQLYDDLFILAQIQRTTVNELINAICSEVVKKNSRQIEDVRTVMQRVTPTVELSLFDTDDNQ